MQDLTVIYLTASQIPELFAEYQRKILLEAIGDTPLISISRKPLGFGVNLLDTDKQGYINIYHQMLRGAKIATTEYVAIAEDDVFYPQEHFAFYRPEKDTFAYNQNRFALFTWGVPTYSWRNRKSNCSLIAPRELMIEALEERFKKYPGDTMRKEHIGELGRANVDRWLGVTIRKSIEVYSETSIIQINHENATEDRQARRRKKLGPIKAYDIPFWGKADELMKHYQ
ncbi:MAG: hypothetical protein NTW60_02800 [Candidatus Wolfebacteria bacterium]|nr:hypothetical protein [Candidatus Wolfebacteria bacterium]